VARRKCRAFFVAWSLPGRWRKYLPNENRLGWGARQAALDAIIAKLRESLNL
jgi:hypothetical protein